MPVFSYTAVNAEGKTVRGTVEAPDVVSAKNALQDLHYEVSNIGEPSRTERVSVKASPVSTPSEAAQSYVFEGTDSAGVLHKGTVQATSRKKAFDHLHANQHLSLNRLSPLGAAPMGGDAELEGWKNSMKATQPVPEKNEVIQPRHISEKPSETPAASTAYHPLISTLRLYAGWLLAWYGLFVAFGYYARERALPWDIPFVGAFAHSSLVFTFVAAIFFFLLLSTVHRSLHGKLLMGTALSVLWVLGVVGVQLS